MIGMLCIYQYRYQLCHCIHAMTIFINLNQVSYFINDSNNLASLGPNWETFYEEMSNILFEYTSEAS